MQYQRWIKVDSLIVVTCFFQHSLILLDKKLSEKKSPQIFKSPYFEN